MADAVQYLWQIIKGEGRLVVDEQSHDPALHHTPSALTLSTAHPSHTLITEKQPESTAAFLSLKVHHACPQQLSHRD